MVRFLRIAVFLLALLSPLLSFAFTSTKSSMHLVGTHNAWNLTATPMTLVADNTWQVDVTLKATDEFKFVPVNWTLSYGDVDANGVADSSGGGNIKVKNGANPYRITFNDLTLTYSVVVNSGPRPPVANAGPDKTVKVGSSVTLNGSLSTSPDGTITSYVWDNGFGTGQSVSKVMGVAGTFTIKLTVTDSNNNSATDTVLVTVNPNQAPTVSAGVNQSVRFNQATINLNGSASDADGSIASLQWIQTSGTAVTITNPTSLAASFANPGVGVYGFRLTATDNDGASTSANVTVTVVANTAPVANAGADIAARKNQLATFNGASSSDSDGTISSFSWASSAFPAPLTGAQPTFTFINTGTFSVVLTVTDNNGATSTDTVIVTVTDAPLKSVQPSMKLAGTHNAWSLTATPMTLVADNTWQVDVTLKATDEFKFVPVSWALSYGDVDANGIADSSGAGNIKVKNGANPYRITFNDLTLAYSLVVNSGPRPPVANAGADQIVKVGSTVTLDASLSTSPDGTIVSYAWDNAFGTGKTVSKVMDTVGTFTVKLTVTDSNNNTATDTVVITVNPKLPPVANAGADQTVKIGSTVTLDASLSTAPDGTIVSYSWDNAFGTGKTVSKVMDTVGTFTVKLTVTDSNNNTATDTVVITVNPIQPPVANAGADKTVKIGSTVTLDASLSTAPDGTITSYVWDNGFGSGKTVSKVMNAVGTFTVNLTVTDSNNKTATDSVVITVVANQVPSVNAGSNQSVAFSQATITLTGTATDADGTIASLQWTQVSGASVTLSNPTSLSTSFSNPGVGVYGFRLTATDNEGASSFANVLVTVIANVAPTANAGADLSAIKGQSVSFNGLGSSDTDGTISSFSWASSAFPAPLTGAQPTFTFANAGTFNVVLTVTDNNGATATDALVVTVSDTPPKSTHPSMHLVGTHNAWNLTSTPMALVADNTWKIDITLKATDEFKFVPVNWALSYGDADANGVADTSGSGNIKVKNGASSYRIIFNDKTLAYTVALNNTGSPFVTNAKAVFVRGGPFGWTAANRTPMTLVGHFSWALDVNFASLSQLFKLDIHALNTNSLDWSQGLGDGRGFQTPNLILNLPANSKVLPDGIMDADTTVNGSQVAFDDVVPVATGRVTIRFNEQTRVYSMISQASAPIANAGEDRTVKAGSTVTLDAFLSTDLDNDIVSYTWDNGFGEGQVVSKQMDVPGIFTVRLTVTDSNNNTSTDSVVITVTPNNPPVANAGPDQTVKVGSSVTLDAGLSTDVDGDIASYLWSNGFGTGKRVSKVMSQAGAFSVTLTVTDANDNTSTDQLSITVNPNQLPTVDAGSNTSARFNQTNIPLHGLANDVDGQIASLKWTQVSGNTVAITNSTSATASFTPAGEGEYTFKLTATDDSSDSASANVTITVLGNTLPIANAGGDVVITAGESVTFNGSASSDADGSINSYVWASSAFPSSLTGVQPSFTFNSVGTFSVELTVTDNDGSTATSTITVTVEKAPFKRTHETMNLVGTFNSWSIGATTMTLVEDYTWQTKVNMFETDKLKFVPETWALSYVDNNLDGVAEASSGGDSASGEIPVTAGTGNYLVTFNDQTKGYSLTLAEEPVLDCENGSTNYPRCDNGGLSVVITEPNSLITIGHSPLSVKGTINHSNAILVINGNRVNHSGGVFEAEVTVQEGYNTIIASATEGPIAQDTDTIAVSLDMTPPYVTVESHTDGQTLSATSITVTGLVNDIVRGTVEAEQAQVTVNNVVAEVSNRSYAAKNVPLVQGVNQIRISASDQVGNTEVKIININNVLPEGNRVLLISGQDQTGNIGTVLPQPLVVKLVDENNNPVANTPVVFRVTQDSGDVAVGTPQEGRAVVVQSNAQGLASTQFRLGLRSGVANNKVKAAAVGFAGDVIFTASATPVLGNKLSVNSGNNQRGVVGQLLPAPLVAVVTDEGANVVKNARVRFESVVGGGTFENAGSIIEVLTDSDGRATARYVLGQLEGLDAQHVRATLMDSPKGQRLIAGFSATAFVPADPGLTTVSGIVLDNQENPIPGITMHIEGTTRKAKTNDEGRFVITSAPVGPIHLVADGSTATVAGEFPDLSFRVVTIAGVDNPLPSPIYMVKLNTEEAVYAGKDAVDLTLEKFPGFKLEIAKNSVTFPDGAREGFVSVTAVNASAVPMAPPNGMQPQFIVTIQPTGTQFDPPARLSLPNVDAHQPGAQVEMYSYDHDLEEFVAIGLGTVSEDGSVVRSNIGVGVVKAGWHCGSQPGGSGTAEHCPECNKCDGTTCVVDNNVIKEESKKCNKCNEGKLEPDIQKETRKYRCGKFGVESQRCYTCKDGECGNHCEPSKDKHSSTIDLPIPVKEWSKLMTDGAKNISKFGQVDVSLTVTGGGTLEQGEGCCKDCSNTEPVIQNEYDVHASINGNLTVLAGIKIPAVENYSGSAGRMIIGATAGIQGAVSVKAGPTFKYTELIGCKDDESCAVISNGVNITGDLDIVGKIDAGYQEWNYEKAGCNFHGSAAQRDPKNALCWELQQGVKGEVKGGLSVGANIHSTFSKCQQGGCEFNIEPIEAKYGAELQVQLWLLEYNYEWKPNPKVLIEGTGPRSCN